MRTRRSVSIAIAAILMSGCVRAGASAEPSVSPSSSPGAAETGRTSPREWKTIGRGTVMVVGHKTVKLTIELTEDP